VVASAGEDELKRLAAIVDARLRAVTAPGRPVSPQALLLAALSLAHDLEDERSKNVKLAHRSREMLGSIMTRLDHAIEASSAPAPAEDEPAP
jgi:cell division protein ZapA